MTTPTNNTDPVTRVLEKLSEHGCNPQKQGKEWLARCPAHDDKRASLAINEGEKGAVVFCHAMCSTAVVLDELGLKPTDLYREAPKAPKDRNQPVRYDYTDEDGTLLFQVERQANKKFVQRIPNPNQQGEWLYRLGSTRRVLFRLPEVLSAIQDGQYIYVVEGEKDALNLVAKGLCATCNPGGAGKWKPEYADSLAGAKVVLIPDNDEPGRQHMDGVAANISDKAMSVRMLKLPALPDKGDVSDWLAKGGDAGRLEHLADQLEPLTGAHETFSAYQLMKRQFTDLEMAVPGVIAEGFTFLVGAPKIGKSWMALGLGLAVADGTMALGSIPVKAGPVLYLALEDTPRRLQRRINMMIGTTEAPENLHFACRWPTMGNGGLEMIEAWIRDNKDARMVMIDTWAKVKSAQSDQGESMYQNDYANVTALKNLADAYGVAIAVVHHQRKAKDDDALNTVAGSTGLTGAADATVILTRQRGRQDGTLYVTGRDVEETRSVVEFDSETGNWIYMGNAEEVEEKKTEDLIIELLLESDEPMGPKDVADALDMKEGTAKWALPKMAQEGLIKKVKRGQYTATEDQAKKAAAKIAAQKAADPKVGGLGAYTTNQPTKDLAPDVPEEDQLDIDDVLAEMELNEFGGDDDKADTDSPAAGDTKEGE